VRLRLESFLVLAVLGLACSPPTTVSPPPPPPSPPPPPPPPTNHPPVAAPGGPYSSTTGTVNFDGSASSDPDGEALTYNWSFGDGGNGTANKPSHTYTADGTFTVTLTVTDARGLASAPATTTANVARPASAVLVGAGNISTCGSTPNDDRTAALLDGIAGIVFTTGDNAFPDGSDAAYECYDASWGRHKARTRPTLGNHEYDNGNANGAFNYFGDRLGATRGLGYYSYEAGDWHVIVLNDRGSSDEFLNPSSAQGQWLADDLARNTKRCTIAMWHVPLFLSSNTSGYIQNPSHRRVWETLYAAGVDVVLNGQQHNYERFAPMTPQGDVDASRGIRQFNVGTGGESVDVFSTIHPNSEAHAAVFGVLKLTLKSDGYDWQFIPVAGSTFTDSGSGTCH
jgi:PKD repeat protein